MNNVIKLNMKYYRVAVKKYLKKHYVVESSFISPIINQNFCLLQCIRYFPIDQLVSKLAINTLDMSVLLGSVWFDKQRLFP
jgi:hypothetical protein